MANLGQCVERCGGVSFRNFWLTRCCLQKQNRTRSRCAKELLKRYFRSKLFYNERFSSCSNASKLSDERRVYQNLAMSIFTQYHPSRHDGDDNESYNKSSTWRCTASMPSACVVSCLASRKCVSVLIYIH